MRKRLAHIYVAGTGGPGGRWRWHVPHWRALLPQALACVALVWRWRPGPVRANRASADDDRVAGGRAF